MRLLLIFGGLLYTYIVRQLLQSSVRVSQAVLKYKTDADIKEVIRLDMYYLCSPLTPYYDHSPTSWELVCNSIYSCWDFLHYQKVCVSRAVRSLLTSLTYPWWYARLPLIHLLRGISQGFILYYPQSQGINLVALYLLLIVRKTWIHSI